MAAETMTEPQREAKELQKQGLSHRQIAARLGISRAAVWRRLNPEKASQHQRRWAKKQRPQNTPASPAR